MWVCFSVVAWADLSDAIVLSQSSLVMCTRRSNELPNPTVANSSLECATKLVVAVTIAAGDTGTSQIEATVSTAQSDDGTNVTLVEPVVIVVTKMEPQAQYPLV
jgi:hypothetical protein